MSTSHFFIRLLVYSVKQMFKKTNLNFATKTAKPSIYKQDVLPSCIEIERLFFYPPAFSFRCKHVRILRVDNFLVYPNYNQHNKL